MQAVLSSGWEDEFLSIPCSSPGNPRCDRRRGRSPFTHERRHRLSSSSDLSTAEENACVCALLPLLYFLCRLLFFYFFVVFQSCSFSSQISLAAPCFPSPFALLSLPTKPTKKNPHTIGCHGTRLPCGSKVFTWSSHVCVSTVAWPSRDAVLIGKRRRSVEFGCEVWKLAAASLAPKHSTHIWTHRHSHHKGWKAIDHII